MNFLSGLKESEKWEALQDMFRRVFSTEEGKVVFTAMLEDLRFFSQTTSPEEEALKNYATYLLKLVVTDDSYGLVDAMINVPRYEGDDDGE